MKIWIEKAEPILTKVVNQNFHTYKVKHWEVNGTYIVDEDACECGAEKFSTYIGSDLLHNTKSKLKELVELKLTGS